MRITIEDVARQAGVSTATVSRVVNKKGKVSTSTIERVQAAITELDYVPHTGARALAANRTKTLGFITPTIGDFFFTDLLRGIEQAAYENEFALLIFATQERPLTELLPAQPLDRHNTDGLIIFANSVDEAALRKFQQRNHPVVTLFQSAPEGTHIPSVTLENKEGASQMTAHLIACGHTNIAFLAGPPNNQDSFEREAGFRETMQTHGIPVNEALISVGGFDANLAETAVNQWLAANQQIDAIFAADDESAQGAIRALQKANVDVPRDTAVVGFDNSRLARFANPPLTTVNVPIEDAGYKAALRLVELIQTGSTQQITILPTELIIRESCGYTLRGES